MLENMRVQKPREFWISIAYFRASMVCYTPDGLFWLNLYISIEALYFGACFKSYFPLFESTKQYRDL